MTQSIGAPAPQSRYLDAVRAGNDRLPRRCAGEYPSHCSRKKPYPHPVPAEKPDPRPIRNPHPLPAQQIPPQPYPVVCQMPVRNPNPMPPVRIDQDCSDGITPDVKADTDQCCSHEAHFKRAHALKLYASCAGVSVAKQMESDTTSTISDPLV